MIIADSSVWVDFFNGVETDQTTQLRSLLGHQLILMGDLVLAEVLQGFDHDRDVRQAKALFDDLDCAEMVGCELAVKSARNYRLLRRWGITVRKTIDVLIATFCVEHHHVLLHADRDFERMREPLGLITI